VTGQVLLGAAAWAESLPTVAGPARHAFSAL